MTDNQFCSICKKEKERQYIEFINKYIYIECQCEKELRKQQERENKEYAIRTAKALRQKSSHIRPMFAKAELETMDVDKHNEKAKRACDYILKNMLDNVAIEKHSLILQGNKGSGKTHIACALVNSFNNALPISEEKCRDIIRGRENGYKPGEYTSVKSSCKFITECELYGMYFDNFNYAKTDSPLNEFKQTKGLLVIDDVGTCTGTKDKIHSLYHDIIDYRYSCLLPTIITTNLSKTELGTYFGDRTLDRLKSTAYFIELTSPQSRR